MDPSCQLPGKLIAQRNTLPSRPYAKILFTIASLWQLLYIAFCSNCFDVHSDVEIPSMKPIMSFTSDYGRLISLASIAILSASGNLTIASRCLNNFCTTNDNIAQIVRIHTEGVMPKIKLRCLITIVLPMKKRYKPNCAVGSIRGGLPTFLCC